MEKHYLTCLDLCNKLKERLRGENVFMKFCNGEVTIFINKDRQYRFERHLNKIIFAISKHISINGMVEVILYEYDKFLQEKYYGRETIKWI